MDNNDNTYIEPTNKELEILSKFCPCKICTQSWPQAILGFFIHGNCRACRGCIQAGRPFIDPSYVAFAREKAKVSLQQ